ncbi:PAS domain S-box protein [Halosolutus gelatinilyticus]|uniref:PAS domain S-box protein n=1 Tax=Halosolutus gelatinilyticus TaxID=2931975 RepID=UPI001FF54903|nr:PAS domain S-box protein [Halosolutus gelatinilyticus]
MESSDSTSDISRGDVRRFFAQLDEPSRPVTTAEVADELECPQETVRRTLQILAERGTIRTRNVDETTRVWWRPSETERPGRRPDGKEFTALVDAVEDYAIFMLNPDGRIVSWNEGAKRIKGYAADDIVGDHFSTFYTDSDVDDGVPDRNLKAATRDGRVEDEGWRVRRDGSRFWANVTITAIRADDGSLRGFTKVTRDMTERREHEQRLRRERDLVERILETVPVSILVSTADGEIVRTNRQLLDGLGVDESALDDSDLGSWDVYDDDGNPIPTDELPWMHVAETGAAVTDYQCQVDVPNLDRRWLSINAAPIADSSRDGRVVFSVVDITEQKERERQLRRESEQTEKLLRTAPIAIAVQNADGDTVMANRRAQDALGLSERELIDEPDDADEWDVYDADGNPLDPSDTPSARVAATGGAVRNEELIIDPPDGDRIQFHVNAVPLFGSDGEVERIVVAGEDITELKDRERQLEQRKAELETELSEIFGRITDAFYALDNDWQFTHVNERAEELLDFQNRGLVGERVWEVFDWTADTRLREEYERAMETQEPASFEFYYPEPLDAWFEIHAYPSETGLSVYFRDVTERKRREHELAERERQLSTLMDNVPGMVYRCRNERGWPMEFVSDACREITGYEPEALERGDISFGDDVIVEADRDDVWEAIQRTVDDREPFSVTYRIETACGDRRWVRSYGRGIFDDDALISLEGIITDVTERKRLERELKESERRYRTLVEHFPNGAVALVDDELRYQTIGGTPLNAADVTTGSQNGTLVEEVLTPPLAAELVPRYEAALEGESDSFELDLDGQVYQFQFVPIHDDDGDVFAALGMSQDITERRGYERKLEESNERLEQFAYAASHDLQEPLRMVTSYLQLIERRYEDALDDDGREFIEFAVDGADRMREMIDGLLEYSRIETQGDPFEPVDLDPVLTDVLDDLTIQIAESDAEIAVGPLPRVVGDPSQLRQVFQNLLDNAIEYSGDEPPRVHVAAERAGSMWEVSVRDEGIGIDSEDTERVFEVFQRLHSRKEHDGTGIGLALCQRIVERHGGEIRVDSERGEGTTFSFTLPTAGDRGE